MGGGCKKGKKKSALRPRQGESTKRREKELARGKERNRGENTGEWPEKKKKERVPYGGGNRGLVPGPTGQLEKKRGHHKTAPLANGQQKKKRMITRKNALPHKKKNGNFRIGHGEKKKPHGKKSPAQTTVRAKGKRGRRKDKKMSPVKKKRGPPAGENEKKKKLEKKRKLPRERSSRLGVGWKGLPERKEKSL